jgi:hypothetical protein
MNIETTAENIKKNYPTEYKQIVDAWKKSKSKTKCKTEKGIKFSFDWGQRIESMNFADLIGGKAFKKEPPLPKDFETFFKSKFDPSTIGSCVMGKWKGGCERSDSLKNVPPEIYESYRENYKKDYAEEKRVASLTPAQRDKEIKDSLKQLSGMGGFMAISIPVSKK